MDIKLTEATQADLPDYWEKEDHHPFLIRADGEVAGFAMVRPYSDERGRMEIGEFFVLRKLKRRGIGRQAAPQQVCPFRDTNYVVPVAATGSSSSR